MTSKPPTEPMGLYASRIIDRLKPHFPTLVLVASLSIIFALRYMLVVQHMDMGPDIANYLTTMNTLFGQDVTGLGLLRPPLIAIPLKLFTLAFGDLTGVRILGILISVAIGMPFYWLAKRISHPWIAVATTTLFVLTPAYSKMLTWGYITMTAIFSILLFLHFFISVLEKPSKFNIILAGVAFSLVAGFHQLSFAFFLFLLLVLIIALALFSRQSLLRNPGPVLASLAIGGILSIPYVPVYVRLLGMQQAGAPSSSISIAPLVDLGFHLLYLPVLLGIVLGIALTIIGLFWLWHKDKNRAIVVGTVFLFSLVLSLFLLPPPFAELNRRADFFMYIPIWLIAGVILSHLWSWQSPHLSGLLRWLPKVITVTAIIALLSSGIVMSQREIRNGLDFYGYLDDTRWDAVQWVRLNTPEDAVIAAYPENLAWWIEAEAKRTVFGVTARHMAPYAIMQERSLIAERMLSRNQGIENGNLRLANCYPYSGAPGNPVIGAYVGGFYQDLLIFDDTQNHLEIEGKDARSMHDAPKKIVIDPMQMVTSYQIYDARVIQTARLDRGSQSATIIYSIQRYGLARTSLDIPLLFCFQPESVSVNPDDHSIEIVQEIKTPFEGIVSVTTHLSLEATGATLRMADAQTDRIPLWLDIEDNEAMLTFTFAITTPHQRSNAEVLHYEVTQLITDHSVDYIAVDLKPDSQIWPDLPPATEIWLNNCPYYSLVYSEGNVRVYQIDLSALP